MFFIKTYIRKFKNFITIIISVIAKHNESQDQSISAEDSDLLQLTLNRLYNHNPSEDTSFEEILSEEGLSTTEIELLEDEVQIQR